MTDAKFDLNTADKNKLMKTLGISDEAAQKIIEHQTEPDSTKEFWKMVDQQFKDITQASKSAFILNKYINLIVVIIGIIIIGSSLSYTWVKGVDPWSTLLSGIGIASFVIVFFNNPQSNINKAVAALASVSIIYKGHKVEYEAIASAIAKLYKGREEDPDTVSDTKTMNELNKVLEDSTKCYVDLLNSHLEAFNADTSKSKDQSVGENKNRE